MAGDWIKFEHATIDKPEVYQISDALEIEPEEVIGRLLKIWVWADQQVFKCDAVSVTEKTLDRIAGRNGFATAMRTVGWLQGKSGFLTFSNFGRHNGQTSKTRSLTVKRMRKKRDADSVTLSSPEKRREEKRIKKEFPISLDTDAFRSAWDNWKEYRKQANLKAWGPMTENAQINKFEAMGAVNAITAIETSIRMGWQGVFEQKPVKLGKKDSFTSADVGLGRNFTSAEVGI